MSATDNNLNGLAMCEHAEDHAFLQFVFVILICIYLNHAGLGSAARELYKEIILSSTVLVYPYSICCGLFISERQ